MLDKMAQIVELLYFYSVSFFTTPLLFFFSQQDVPLAGVVRSFSGASTVVPVLPQRDSTKVWPEEAHDGSSGWGDWYGC